MACQASQVGFEHRSLDPSLHLDPLDTPPRMLTPCPSSQGSCQAPKPPLLPAQVVTAQCSRCCRAC